MTENNVGRVWSNRALVRRDSKGLGDRRSLSRELFPGEEITHRDVGLEQERAASAEEPLGGNIDTSGPT